MVAIVLVKYRALCQLQWVDEKLRSRKDKFRPFFFDIQGDKNSFFEVFKVPKTKCIALDKFDEIISGFQFCVGIGQLKGVDNLLFILEEGFKDSLKKRMNQLKLALNESEKICLAPCSESEKARADRYYSGVSSLLNSSKACLESLCWLDAYEKQGDKIAYRSVYDYPSV